MKQCTKELKTINLTVILFFIYKRWYQIPFLCQSFKFKSCRIYSPFSIWVKTFFFHHCYSIKLILPKTKLLTPWFIEACLAISHTISHTSTSTMGNFLGTKPYGGLIVREGIKRRWRMRLDLTYPPTHSLTVHHFL